MEHAQKQTLIRLLISLCVVLLVFGAGAVSGYVIAIRRTGSVPDAREHETVARRLETVADRVGQGAASAQSGVSEARELVEQSSGGAQAIGERALRIADGQQGAWAAAESIEGGIREIERILCGARTKEHPP